MQTYLADFHGMTASLKKNENATDGGRVVALCIDCHGVHDITKTEAPASAVMKANLVKTCAEVPPGRVAELLGRVAVALRADLQEGAARLRRQASSTTS